MPSLGLLRKRGVRLSDRLEMTVTVDWDFALKTKQKAKVSQNGPQGSVMFIQHGLKSINTQKPLRCSG